MFKIKTLNAISDVIHEELSAEQYVISPEEPVPEGILVRSAVMHDAPLNPELLGIARAGAGVNNIPLDKCTKQGIAVFNTPGANANAVAELVLGALVLGSRNVAAGIRWADTLKGQENVPKLVEKGKGQFVGPELRGKTLGVIGLGRDWAARRERRQRWIRHESRRLRPVYFGRKRMGIEQQRPPRCDE